MKLEAQLAAMKHRAWRAAADARRVVTRAGSNAPALAALGEPDRTDPIEWLRATSDRHDAYRRSIEPAAGRIAAVCVSRRPQLIAQVAQQMAAQEIDPSRLDVVVVANLAAVESGPIDPASADGASMVAEIEAAFSGFSSFRLEIPPAGTTLGAGLNRALDLTDARFVAKIDDDDLYGPHHLADSLRAHIYAGAGVVGKHSYYASMTASGRTVLRFPTNEFRYSSTLAGGTLVIDRDRVGDLRFADVSLGEDRAFLAACHRRGISTFAADRFNFTQVRSDDNTWRLDDAAFLAGAIDVDVDAPEHRIDR
ncbi:MAG: hypothetical protein ACE37B_05310 [Ilumatobacter sp.]|uniref:hypothetical protein n=1 Tax=Ilumatobacter sp. TaxID=1967498 RepID=UPI00391D1414